MAKRFNLERIDAADGELGHMNSAVPEVPGHSALSKDSSSKIKGDPTCSRNVRGNKSNCPGQSTFKIS